MFDSELSVILVHWYLSIQCLCSNVVAANIPCLSPQEGFDIRKMKENRCLSLSCKIDIHWISTYGYKVLTITILLSQTCLFSSFCRNATLLIGHWQKESDICLRSILTASTRTDEKLRRPKIIHPILQKKYSVLLSCLYTE